MTSGGQSQCDGTGNSLLCRREHLAWVSKLLHSFKPTLAGIELPTWQPRVPNCSACQDHETFGHLNATCPFAGSCWWGHDHSSLRLSKVPSKTCYCTSKVSNIRICVHI
eukprot:3546134-Amphidinium_carterae.1